MNDTLITHLLLVVVLTYISDYPLPWTIVSWILAGLLLLNWALSAYRWWLERKIEKLRQLR